MVRKLFGIINIGTGLFVGLLAYTGISNYLGGNEEDVSKYEQLVKEGITTVGILDSSYKEANIKVIGVRAKYYIIKYEFDVEGVSYNGEYFFDHLDSLKFKTVKVNYLASNPFINEANVEKQLKDAKQNLESEIDLWLGIGAAIISGFLLILGIRKIKS